MHQLDIATACGVIERDFWNMSPGYLNELAAVHAKRSEHERELAAWVVSSLLRGCFGKDAPTPNELLGRTTDA